jgi:hypothetical protein
MKLPTVLLECPTPKPQTFLYGAQFIPLINGVGFLAEFLVTPTIIGVPISSGGAAFKVEWGS